jgi:hypothetical protein
MIQGRLPLAAFARRVLVVAAIVVLGLPLWRIADALLPAFGAMLVAVILRTAAAPLAVVAFVAVKELWVREALGGRTDVPGEDRQAPSG